MKEDEIKRRKKAVVCGAGGFIGSHLVKWLKANDYWVRGVDLKYPEFSPSPADEFFIADLRDVAKTSLALFSPTQSEFGDDQSFDEVYQLAADMGGAGFVFTGDNDADIMTNSALINLNVSRICVKFGVKKVFYSSSACIYPQDLQDVEANSFLFSLSERDAYPADPDSEYGWEKIFSERLWTAVARNYNLDVRIARFHNIFGPEGTYTGGREKAPAALCRKIALAKTSIDIWGDGSQVRSFLYIDECLEGVRRLMDSDVKEIINIGSDESVTIDELAHMIEKVSGKVVTLEYDLSKPTGVSARNSDNTLIGDLLKWKPDYPLEKGIRKTYNWILNEVNK